MSDKPLHERIAEYMAVPYHAKIGDWPHDLLREAAAELSRMRTALEIVRDWKLPKEYMKEFARDVLTGQEPAIAERALTAGSGNE